MKLLTPDHCITTILLASGETLTHQETLRSLTHKRLVFRGTWQGQAVLAKLFFNSKRVARYIERELRGYRALQQQQIATPELLLNTRSQDGQYFILLYRYLDNATPTTFNQTLITLLAQQHAAGIYQSDLHRSNYLATAHGLYCVDNASLVVKSQPLNERDSLYNLCLAMAQAGKRLWDSDCLIMLNQYCEMRSWIADERLVTATQKYFATVNHQFIRRRLKKLLRTNREFVHYTLPNKRGMYRREADSVELQALLASPESFFQDAALIKAGNTTTIVRATLDNKPIVIKRYNIKSFWHGIKRALQTSRARRCWCNAYVLLHLGVTTPRPLAFIETKNHGFNSTAYLITDYLPGERLDELLSAKPAESIDVMITAQFERLFRLMKQFNFSHGDMKPTNFWWSENKLMVTDLDSMRFHSSRLNERKVLKDQERLRRR